MVIIICPRGETLVGTSRFIMFPPRGSFRRLTGSSSFGAFDVALKALRVISPIELNSGLA